MNTVGHVEQIPTAGNTFARLVRMLQEQNVRPTHFLIVQMTYHPHLANNLRQRVPLALFQFIQGKKYVHNLGPDDDITITWKSSNAGSSMIYYAISRLDESYVRQLTDLLLGEANAFILQKTDLKDGNFQMSYIVAKNLNYNLNLANGDEAAVAVAGQMLAAAPAPLIVGAAAPLQLQAPAAAAAAAAVPAPAAAAAASSAAAAAAAAI